MLKVARDVNEFRSKYRKNHHLSKICLKLEGKNLRMVGQLHDSYYTNAVRITVHDKIRTTFTDAVVHERQ